MNHQTIGLTVFVNDQECAGDLVVERDSQVVWSEGPRRDPNWTFMDAQGHFHSYGKGEKLPTLDNEPEHIDCDGACGGHCEGYSVPHYLCRICREEVFPGTIPGPHSVEIHGPTSWTVRVRGEGRSPLRYDDRVTVRIPDDDGALFGIAKVYETGARYGSSELATFEVELIGEGPLSRTDAP